MILVDAPCSGKVCSEKTRKPSWNGARIICVFVKSVKKNTFRRVDALRPQGAISCIARVPTIPEKMKIY